MKTLNESDALDASAEQPQLDFPPIRNGVDYLVSVIDLLYTGKDWSTHRVPTPRDVKYAVLHLQAAAEVLLKTRLLREHWSLVFKDPAQASWSRFSRGDFDSCGIDDAVHRLRKIAAVTVRDADHKALKALAKDRNALQHYGLTHNARAVEVRAGTVLDFLVRFLDEELLPNLTRNEENTIGEDMARVRDGLDGIETFVAQRSKRVYGELRESGLAHRAISCPDCGSRAMVVEPGSNRCHFCGMSYPNAYMLARSWSSYLEPGEELMTCGECGESTVSVEVDMLDDPGNLYLFCFSCTARAPDPT